MPSSYTDLGFNKQASGENENTWGDILNDEAIELIDDAIRGSTAFTLSGSKTLTNTQGVANEARAAILHITGGTGGTVTIPSYSKLYVVINQASGDVIISAGGATTATVAAGETAQVAADGLTAVRKVRYTDFGGARLTSVGNPSENDDAATKAYVDAQAFSAALPSGASAGEVVQYDGTNAGWAELGVADVTGAAPLDAPNFINGVDVSGDASITGDASIAGAAEVTGLLTLEAGLDQIGGTVSGVTAVAAQDIDFSDNDCQTKSISSNTTFTVSGLQAGKLQVVILVLTISSGAVPSFPAAFGFHLGVDFLSSLGNGEHWLTITTIDGGASGVIGLFAKAVS